MEPQKIWQTKIGKPLPQKGRGNPNSGGEEMRKLALCMAILLCFSQTIFATNPATKSSIKIAIIDSGISTKALDKANVSSGKNYILPEDSTEDRLNHGTAIASLILGKPTRGLLGAYPQASLVPLVYCSVMDKKIVKGDAVMLAKCIRDAVDIFSCRVINLSAGILINSQELKAACDYAEQKGAVIVAAVGNDNVDAPEHYYYPAAYDTVMGVGALDDGGRVAGFSQRNKSVSLVAKGDNLWVARASGKMSYVSGTSYACAFVAAAAAQILEENATLSPSDVRKLLCESATDLGAAGYDMESGYGALNAKKALELAKSYEAVAGHQD